MLITFSVKSNKLLNDSDYTRSFDFSTRKLTHSLNYTNLYYFEN
jgi:hypothetical protein